MKQIFLLFVLVFIVTACATDGSFQMPNIMVEHKKSGKLIGCMPIPERNVQSCEYEDDNIRFKLEMPMGVEPPAVIEGSK